MPSTFMRRSIDFDFMNDNEGRKQSKFFTWFIDSYKIDIEDVGTICNFDAYIYVSYLKLSAQFFAVLSLLSIICFYFTTSSKITTKRTI